MTWIMKKKWKTSYIYSPAEILNKSQIGEHDLKRVKWQPACLGCGDLANKKNKAKLFGKHGFLCNDCKKKYFRCKGVVNPEPEKEAKSNE